ncbi:MAG: cation diffusion facilitator family transporter [Planctomycetota bacterium]
MSTDLSPTHREIADREKRQVALSSLLAAVVLTGTKLAVGLWTNSLGILSEAAHSGLDLVAAGITLWAVRVSGRPADRDHTYGHGKFENLSALFETILLLATCGWIMWEAVSRLVRPGTVEVHPSVWAFAVVIGSIVVDYSRAKALRRVARKYGSQALEADALHFSSDIWSSCVVLLGLIGVLLAQRMQIAWLATADTIAALAVAVIVVVVSLRLGRRAIDDLLDAVPAELHDRVRAAAAEVSDVQEVNQVRLRRSGPSFFVDVTLSVGRAAAFERVHEIADEAEAAVRRIVPHADVIVHVEPVAQDSEDLTTTIQVLAARRQLGAHSVRIYEAPGGLAADLHLEVDPSLQLDAAHAQVTAFETELRENAPQLLRVVTHIEPAGAPQAIPAEPARQALVEEASLDFLRREAIQAEAHDLRVQWVEGEVAVTVCVKLPADTPITAAHDVTRRLEEHLRKRVPRLGRVVIHVEPSGECRTETPQSGEATPVPDETGNTG